MKQDIEEFLGQFYLSIGIDPTNYSWMMRLSLLLLILVFTLLFTRLFRLLLIPFIHRLTAKTKAKWDEALFNRRLLIAFSRLLPPIIWYLFLPMAFATTPTLLLILQKACLIYLVVTTLRLISTFLSTLYELSSNHEKLRHRPLKGIYQMVQLIAILVGVIIMISILIDKDATTILAGLGASAAVMMLIFKDSILGLVAGIQLSANDMLRPGDWITMSKYGADGYVIEVSLTTVKVQNFDKTITTLPPYALVSDSYQNWRGMWENGGRRIKRSLFIDMNTIRFCPSAAEPASVADQAAEAPVNLRLYRQYVLDYLERHPHVKQDMMKMVRQLPSTPQGLPLEVYCFADTTEWVEYERIQDEIFDHLIAVLPRFGLRIYQQPAGADFNRGGAATDGGVRMPS
ncbi:MAG: mechanosensitive ion channel [Bacteroidaceae bacterium]|nr:mechanosensitive ion channel [Bacteroidaceae bacterium]